LYEQRCEIRSLAVGILYIGRRSFTNYSNYSKKALSLFMPYKNAPWANGRGNPTRSEEPVNSMIKEVKKFDVRGQGAPSNAKRPLKLTKISEEPGTTKERGGLESQDEVSNDVAMGPLFYVLLHLGIYLEDFLARLPNSTYLFTDSRTDNAPKNLKQTIRNRLEKVAAVIKPPTSYGFYYGTTDVQSQSSVQDSQ
jgi:hypothetical protein